MYPYLLVHLRSGATYTKVYSKDSYKRCAGSAIGTSLFMGILKLLKLYENEFEATKRASDGNSDNVDMTVNDIYGRCYKEQGLPGDLIASSFGKLKDKS